MCHQRWKDRWESWHGWWQPIDSANTYRSGVLWSQMSAANIIVGRTQTATSVILNIPVTGSGSQSPTPCLSSSKPYPTHRHLLLINQITADSFTWQTRDIGDIDELWLFQTLPVMNTRCSYKKSLLFFYCVTDETLYKLVHWCIERCWHLAFFWPLLLI